MSALPAILPDADTPAAWALAQEARRLRDALDIAERRALRFADDLAFERAAHAETAARLAWTEERLRAQSNAARPCTSSS